jgi:hypothetical protein
VSDSNGNDSSSRATASAALIVIGLAAALVDLFYEPFVFTPVAALAMLIGTAISSRYRRFGLAAAGIVTACFVIGSAVAVWGSRALY